MLLLFEVVLLFGGDEVSTLDEEDDTDDDVDDAVEVCDNGKGDAESVIIYRSQTFRNPDLVGTALLLVFDNSLLRDDDSGLREYPGERL